MMFLKEDGSCYQGVIYDESLTPPAEVVPVDCELVHFDETNSNYALMVALFVGPDTEGLAADYVGVPPRSVVKYDFETKGFVFTKPIRPKVIDMVREFRNAELANTDHLLMIPDLPDELKQKTIEYRKSLRDLTKGAKDSWNHLDYPWPEKPDHHA